MELFIYGGLVTGLSVGILILILISMAALGNLWNAPLSSVVFSISVGVFAAAIASIELNRVVEFAREAESKAERNQVAADAYFNTCVDSTGSMPILKNQEKE